MVYLLISVFHWKYHIFAWISWSMKPFLTRTLPKFPNAKEVYLFNSVTCAEHLQQKTRKRNMLAIIYLFLHCSKMWVITTERKSPLPSHRKIIRAGITQTPLTSKWGWFSSISQFQNPSTAWNNRRRKLFYVLNLWHAFCVDFIIFDWFLS